MFRSRSGLLTLIAIASLLVACTRKSNAPPQAGTQTNTVHPLVITGPQSAVEAPGPNSDAKQYVDFGASSGARGDLDGAIAAFNSAINLDPKFAPAYYDLGYAKSLQGKADEAISNYDEAIQLDPKYRDAYSQRGNLKGRRGDFPGAIEDFEQVVRIDPKFAVGYYNLGHALYFTGDLDGAIKQLDQALSLDPNLPYAYFIRGLVRHAQAHNTEATADFRKSLGLNFPDAAFWVFLCETQDGLADPARQDLSDALAKPQAFKPDGFTTAIGAFLLGKLPQDALIAKATAAKAGVREEYACAAWYYAGAMQRMAGNVAAARDCYGKAIATGSKGSEEYVEAQRELSSLPGL